MGIRSSRKIWRDVAVSLLAILSLAACGGSSDGDDDPGTDAGTALDGGTPDGGEPVDSGVPQPPEPAPAGWFLDDAESTDEMCSNQKDDFSTGHMDCDNTWCTNTVAVQVCASLENTDELCSDGKDNPERPVGTSYYDGLVDCADPDCLKNPRITVCAHLHPLMWETPESCAAGRDDDSDGLAGCADPDCWTAQAVAAAGCDVQGRKRVLFDNAHHQRAGNGDWVVDTSGRLPWPSVPQKEDDWSGAMSSFGKSLFDTGRFTVETLRPSSRFGYGDGSEQDLKNYDVLVVPEPSSRFTPEESKAVVDFVRNGGGLLMVADHSESDRDGNGWDSVQVFNDMLQTATAGGGEEASTASPFGFHVDSIGYSESGRLDKLNGNVAATLSEGASEHPVMNGPHGTVAKAGMFKGGLFVIEDGETARPLIHAVPLGTEGYAEGSPFVVAANPGKGRVVAVGDSAILNDGTDSHGYVKKSYDSWNDAGTQNAALFLNAVEWLSGTQAEAPSEDASAESR